MIVTLYYRSGSSDKVYTIEKLQSGAGFNILCANGRRGSSMTPRPKNNQPVNEAEADKIFAKVFREKVSGGYTDDVSGVPYTPCVFDLTTLSGAATPAQAASISTVAATPQPTGINVQLLNPVDDAELDDFFTNDNFAAQEKYDGKRIALVLDKGDVYGVNRTGLKCGIPATLTAGVGKVAELCRQVFNVGIEQFILDGEQIGDDYFAFDLLELNGVDFRPQSYAARYKRLKTILCGNLLKSPIPNFTCIDLITCETAKREFFARIKAANLEGVVFKNVKAPYEAGRPNSGGTQRKYKFCSEATCLVSGQNGSKRSISLQVTGSNGQLIDIGNCTIPANFTMPAFGTLVEIRYLYAYPNGSLYQPVYKGQRTDKIAPDLYDTLKFKAQPAAVAY